MLEERKKFEVVKLHEISTISGKIIDLSDPQPEDISIVDIAHSLSLLARYTGHIKFHYSVAEHSLLVCRLVKYSLDTVETSVGPEFSDLLPISYHTILLYALLHDAGEAYYNDISTPQKRLLGHPFSQLRDNIDQAVNTAFGLNEIIGPKAKNSVRSKTKRLVKIADDLAYLIERKYVAPVKGREVQLPDFDLEEFYPVREKEWGQVKKEFLLAFRSLAFRVAWPE